MKWLFQLIILLYAIPVQAKIVMLYCKWDDIPTRFTVIIDDDSTIVAHIFQNGTMMMADGVFDENTLGYDNKNQGGNIYTHYFINRIDLSFVTHSKGNNQQDVILTGKCSFNEPVQKF